MENISASRGKRLLSRFSHERNDLYNVIPPKAGIQEGRPGIRKQPFVNISRNGKGFGR
jgi:hypothetical protein